ncbi:hypothetical protein B0I35DRAFT_407825 [Stachybotrys elegans]|uniref:Uncharacterized protein n=1 Tax=Stachybotrys elegans TaxID=80388 RepID=A0A8K0WTP2_9HYPO|nr:hypothetical protein B0I35DRAFT_407825 [Stachybotrys elegans]
MDPVTEGPMHVGCTQPKALLFPWVGDVVRGIVSTWIQPQGQWYDGYPLGTWIQLVVSRHYGGIDATRMHQRPVKALNWPKLLDGKPWKFARSSIAKPVTSWQGITATLDMPHLHPYGVSVQICVRVALNRGRLHVAVTGLRFYHYWYLYL